MDFAFITKEDETPFRFVTGLVRTPSKTRSHFVTVGLAGGVLPGRYRNLPLGARVARAPADDGGMSTLLRLLLLTALLAGPLSAAPKKKLWGELKVGTSARQAVTLLGEPLARRRGKGFETWTYDQGAEVLLYRGAAVIGWTAPASANLPARSGDVWSLQPDDEYYATLYSVLETFGSIPAPAGAKEETAAAPAASSGSGYEQYLRRKG